MKAFSKLTRDEKLELLTAWVDGGVIEYDAGKGWLKVDRPTWNPDFTYRIKSAILEVGKTYADKYGDKWTCIAVDDTYAYMRLGKGGPAYAWHLNGVSKAHISSTYNVNPSKPVEVGK